jgi:hypothetical protein
MKTYALMDSQIIKVHEGSLKNFLNQLSLKNLFDLPGYKRQIFKLFQVSKKIPLYFNKELLLIPLININNYDVIYLNYFKIKRYQIFLKSVRIFMDDGTTFDYHHHITSFMRLIELSQSIINIKEGKSYGEKNY